MLLQFEFITFFAKEDRFKGLGLDVNLEYGDLENWDLELETGS